ncbi:MAG: hypothetical protein PHH54_02135 [Candidatus Nanoarchaeia archaeon]|nr:hypothetical protein [Candidatus Nanoarchaeia archaeon]MDD5740761.1 hypothetical protein [Candidatus Nanoarchaeia archaeon]
MKKDVLFICKSNVNRSQYAEGFYNKLINKNKAISAGVRVPAEKPSKKGATIMLEEGVDISKQKVKLLKRSMLKNVKKVVVICRKQFLPKYVLKFENIEFWNIRDPHFSSMKERRKIRDKIKKKILKLNPKS